MQYYQLYVPKPSTEMCLFILNKGIRFLGQTADLCILQVNSEERFRMSTVIWREQRTRYNQLNNVGKHNSTGSGILVCSKIYLGGFHWSACDLWRNSDWNEVSWRDH
ncbi:hypothetical protein TNCV_2868921 [Trichonephila clavipes]|nr:hypothetical protein TNCV_2868921 [Trichonephila clavipes]